MITRPRILSYSDYLELPEEMIRYEIVNGEVLSMTPASGEVHQRIAGNLFVQLHAFVSRRESGAVYFAPLDVVVQKEPLRTRQPDLMYISRQRAEIVTDRIMGGPDLVVEILSPGNPRPDFDEKLLDYVGLGVRECWLFSPEARTIEVLQLESRRYTRCGLYGSGERLESAVLPGIEIDLDRVFTSAFAK